MLLVGDNDICVDKVVAVMIGVEHELIHTAGMLDFGFGVRKRVFHRMIRLMKVSKQNAMKSGHDLSRLRKLRPTLRAWLNETNR